MTQIGNSTVVAHRSLLIPIGQEAVVDLSLAGDSFEATVTFEDDSRSVQAVEIQAARPTGCRIVFRNFNSEMGSVLRESLQLTTHTDGRIITMLAFASRIGSINRLELQFMAGPG